VNPRDVLRYGHADIERLLHRVRPRDWDRVALGVWTTKDLVGHLGAFEVRFHEILVVFSGGEPTTSLRMTSPATFNDDQAAIRREWPVDEVLEELRGAHAGVMSVVDRIDADRWREVGTIPWYGPEYSLEDLAIYSQYGHKREHGPQLEAVLETD
jgi:hypothetical protein